ALPACDRCMARHDAIRRFPPAAHRPAGGAVRPRPAARHRARATERALPGRAGGVAARARPAAQDRRVRTLLRPTAEQCRADRCAAVLSAPRSLRGRLPAIRAGPPARGPRHRAGGAVARGRSVRRGRGAAHGECGSAVTPDRAGDSVSRDMARAIPPGVAGVGARSLRLAPPLVTSLYSRIHLRPSNDCSMTTEARTGYQPARIEEKWQAYWAERGTNSLTDERLRVAERPFYNLMMFPYPSAEGLHGGNMYASTGADIYGRWKRLLGEDVFEPIGLDAFGIHSENFALKQGTHPMELIPSNIRNFTRQLKRIGAMYDWNHTVDTTAPEYYRWTQWIFLQLYDMGLAEKKEAPVNWCPSCKTVLANEQVIAGACERCGTPVETRTLSQWFFR